MAGSAGTSRFCDHQPFPPPCEEGDKQYLHTDGAAVGRTRPHHAGCGVYRRDKDRIQGQQIHLRMAQDRREEPSEAAGEDTCIAPADR